MLTRALIVLLIVLNLGVATWWALAPAPSIPTPTPPADGPRLQLLGEAGRLAPVSQSAAAAPDQHPETAPSTGTAAQCYTLGPFTDVTALAAAQKSLQPRVIRLHVRTTTTGRHGWRVWLPPLADHDSAIAMAARIEAAGFKDYYIVPTGDEQNSIALGRFGNQAAAERQQAALTAAGFPAQAEALGAATQWIDIVSGGDLDMGLLRRQTGATQARILDCAGLTPSPASATAR
jgi:hypothetical protein